MVIAPEKLAVVDGMLIDGDNFVVGNEGKRERVGVGEIRAEDEGRASDRPEGHEGDLFVMGEAGLVVVVSPGADVAERDHVGIGEMAGTAVRGPGVEACELFVEGGPIIPEVVADSPHIGVGGDVRTLGDGGGAGGGGEDDGATGAVDGFADRFDFGCVVGGREVIDFDEVEVPGGEEGEDGVVVFLRRAWPCRCRTCRCSSGRGMWCRRCRRRGNLCRGWGDFGRRPGGEFRAGDGGRT